MRSWASPLASSWVRRVEQYVSRWSAPWSFAPDRGATDPFAGLLPWDLTTAEALEVPARGGDAYGATLLDFAGVCVMRRAMEEDGAAVEASREAAVALVEDALKRVRARGMNDDDLDDDGAAGFHFADASQRGPGRVDLRLDGVLRRPPFDAFERAQPWAGLLRRALGDDFRLLRRGLVTTWAGARDQVFHADGPRVPPDVWRTHDKGAAPRIMREDLPAHCVNVFLPLVDLTLANGPTAFLPGSHKAHLARALQTEADDPGSQAGAGAPAILTVKAGDAVIFDQRTHHAGAANRSDHMRPILYLVYARPWFDEAMHRDLLARQGDIDDPAMIILGPTATPDAASAPHEARRAAPPPPPPPPRLFSES